MKVLLLEDDAELGAAVERALRRAGFAVDLARTLLDLDLALAVSEYDVLVMDRMLPDGDSVSYVARLRSRESAVPILLLTGRDSVADRVAGFEHGADDYLTKPFAEPELVARVRALARRGPAPVQHVIQVGDVEIDVQRHTVQRAGVQLTLREKEFVVLHFLATRTGQVVSRTDLIEHCWDEMHDPTSNVVDVTVGNLRRRLGEPDMISTVRGAGYRLET